MKPSNHFSSEYVCKSCNAKCDKYLLEGRISYKPNRIKYVKTLSSDVLASACNYYNIARLNLETVITKDSNDRDLE